MGTENPYRLPWGVEYFKGEGISHLVSGIVDCDGEGVVEGEGIKNKDIAQFIIKCVNSSGEG